MTSLATPRDLLTATVWLRGQNFTVKGFYEDSALIVESLDPPVDYNELADHEWEEIEYQFGLQLNSTMEGNEAT